MKHLRLLIFCCCLWAITDRTRAIEPVIVNRVRFLPAPEREQAMVGGKISGSNVSSSEGFKVLAEIKMAPTRNEWSEIKFDNATPYRWVRYEAPSGSRGNIAELEFYSGEKKLHGAGFGTAGFLAPGGHWKTVFDEKPETWFNSNNTDGQYVGLDFEDQAATARPVITPGGGDWDKPQTVKMKSVTPGATIRYTLDGTTPDVQGGQLYTTPFLIDKNTTLVAAAFSDGLAVSPASIATIWIGKPAREPMNSFHVGNSLTGNASRFKTFIRTSGGRDDFPVYLIGGSLTVKLWNESQGADKKRWDETYAKAVHPLDYFTLQPRDFNVAEEADYATRFIKLVREKSPDVQPWLYAEWVEMERARPTDKGEVPSYEMKKTFPALTWEESMSAMLLYNEEVQHEIAARDHEGKRVRILPTALALGWARKLIDEGKFPGVEPGQMNFYQTLFEDHVHVNASGCYLVALTWYAALYRESPEDKLLPIGTSLTAEQSRVLQRLAWDIVKNYPDCGLYEEGAERCATPSFERKGKTIELRSATPGTWFRYTLDGTTPTRTNGYVYCGVISEQAGIQVKAVAYKSGMTDSAVGQSPAPMIPNYADISYGTNPHQLLDIYVPPRGSGPFPVLIWYGGLWEPAKHAVDPNRFLPQGVAVIAVESRTLKDGVDEKATPPVSYPMNDACRAVQFVRLNAAKWNLDPRRIAVGGGSQGTLPALYVGCAGERANAQASDPVERVSTEVTCVAAYRSQPTIDPQRMQEWVPGVQWGAPALGCSFEESLKRRDELLPFIEKWSPDALLHPGAAPIYFENEWGLTQPEKITEANYKVHSPAWGLGFQKLAEKAGVTCLVKFPDHPTEGYKDIWDFIVQELQAPVP
jgi:acetyl esterase/lipase